MTAIQTGKKTNLSWRHGLLAALPIAAGYIPIAVAFGLTANAAGLSFTTAQSMSLFVFAGASQFMAIQMLVAGAGSLEIVMATFILNLRHLLMSASLAERLNSGVTTGQRLLMAFGITDETYAVAILRSEPLTFSFVISVNTVAFLAWNLGTACGLVAAAALPEVLRQSLGIALYAMFIGLLIPAGRQWRPGLIIAGMAAIINSLFSWLPLLNRLGNSWGVVSSIIAAAAIGVILFPKREG